MAQLRKAAAACPELTSGRGFALGGNYALVATARVQGRGDDGGSAYSVDKEDDEVCKAAVATLQFYGMRERESD